MSDGRRTVLEYAAIPDGRLDGVLMKIQCVVDVLVDHRPWVGRGYGAIAYFPAVGVLWRSGRARR